MKKLIQTGLFGDEEELKKPEERKPFSPDEVNAFLEEAPRVLLDELTDSLQAIRKEIDKSADSVILTDSKKRFWLNLEWVFELSETPAVLPFDLACSVEGVDPEQIRNRMSVAFSHQIREFLNAYASAQPLDQARVKRKLNRYICVGD